MTELLRHPHVTPRRPAAGQPPGPGGAAALRGTSTFGRLALGAAAAAGAYALFRGSRPQLDLRGRVCLVTGGSRGLGLRLAEELGRHGARIAICARGAEGLALAAERLAGRGIEVETFVCDLMLRDEAEALPARVADRFGRLDVLVNNAGVILVAPFEDHAVDDFERSLAVHFWAPLYLARAALPLLRQAREGRIVTIGSIGGAVAVPHLAAYCAGKFAGVALSECLHAELRRYGIKVTTVLPALMRTGSFVHAELRGPREAEASWFGVASSAPLLTIDAGVAARRIVGACRRGDPVLTFNWSGKLGVRADGAMPGLSAWVRAAAAALLPEPTREPSAREPLADHPSRWVPGPATRLGDRAAAENLELVGERARYRVERV